MKGWWWDLFTVETPAGDGQALNTPELTRSCTQGVGWGCGWGGVGVGVGGRASLDQPL